MLRFSKIFGTSQIYEAIPAALLTNGQKTLSLHECRITVVGANSREVYVSYRAFKQLSSSPAHGLGPTSNPGLLGSGGEGGEDHGQYLLATHIAVFRTKERTLETLYVNKKGICDCTGVTRHRELPLLALTIQVRMKRPISAPDGGVSASAPAAASIAGAIGTSGGGGGTSGGRQRGTSGEGRAHQYMSYIVELTKGLVVRVKVTEDVPQECHFIRDTDGKGAGLILIQYGKSIRHYFISPKTFGSSRGHSSTLQEIRIGAPVKSFVWCQWDEQRHLHVLMYNEKKRLVLKGITFSQKGYKDIYE